MTTKSHSKLAPISSERIADLIEELVIDDPAIESRLYSVHTDLIQEAVKRLRTSSDTVQSGVMVCFNCKHCKPIRDYRNFDDLKPPHGYYCPIITMNVDPDYTCNRWVSKKEGEENES